ncbi:MAG: site-2 protease family protein [Thermomicrobiales bacterium]
MRSFTIGRVQGIAINIHPTFALVPLLVIWNQQQAGGWDASALVFGMILTGLVFACVLLHELGHGAMALQFGIRVHDITLWPMGGVARIETAAAAPKVEWLVAMAGPAINVAIAIGLLPLIVLYGLLRGYRSPGPLMDEVFVADGTGALLVYLLLVNLLLVAFNLLPAFPMDGGRILRAWLTEVTDRDTATRVAVVIGQVIAAGLIVAGPVFGQYSLVLVGIFVIVAARSEGRTVRLETAMRRLSVGQFALWDSGGIEPTRTVPHALRGGPRDVVVTDDGRVVGMLWRGQVLRAMRDGLESRLVGEVMDRDVVSADARDSVFDVQQLMIRLDRWAIPITEDGLYKGVFTGERFMHVYRQLEVGQARGRPTGVFGQVSQGLSDMLRAFGR